MIRTSALFGEMYDDVGGGIQRLLVNANILNMEILLSTVPPYSETAAVYYELLGLLIVILSIQVTLASVESLASESHTEQDGQLRFAIVAEALENRWTQRPRYRDDDKRRL